VFRFASNETLFALSLIPMLGVFFFLTRSARRRALAVLGEVELIQKLSATLSQRARVTKSLLTLAAVALLVLALARPQFGTRVETVQSEGQDVVVALDVSRSMMAEDVAPNRLERARLEIMRIIQRLEGDRIGLVAFAGNAFVQSPLTVDYGAATLFLNAMDPGLIPVQGTNLGEALTVALDAFEEGTRDYRVLVVVTDGEDHEGEIAQALERAVEEGVRIHTVGIGSLEGVPIPEFNAAGARSGFLRDEEGNVVTTRLDESTLMRVAESTGGRYFPALGLRANLDPLIEEITGEEGRELEVREVTQFDEQFQIFLGLALALLLIESLMSDRRTGKAIWVGRFS
jgi:Ca-activated chloride channel family protein